jgi:hypothetical protein
VFNLNDNIQSIQTIVHSPSLVHTDLIHSGGVKLILRVKTSSLSEMMRSCKLSKMSALTYSLVSSAVVEDTLIFVFTSSCL